MKDKSSYWFKGTQKGNFSNQGNDTFDPNKNYLGIRLQQGVPLLDRDWNELEDIRRYQDVMLRKHYLGNGTPDGGFKISACNPPTNNFIISSGRCLVNGFEAVNEKGAQGYCDNYLAQRDIHGLIAVPDLNPPNTGNNRIDMVYLDLWIVEVTNDKAKDPEGDPELGNYHKDVGICTSIRHKLKWCIKVAEGTHHAPDAEDGHHYYEIARFIRRGAAISDIEIEDLRLKCQPMGVISSILEGEMPSSPEIELIHNGFDSFTDPFEDSRGDIWIFSYDVRSKTIKWILYSNGEWQINQIISNEGIAVHLYSIYESPKNGHIWLFWGKELTDKSIELWCEEFNLTARVSEMLITKGNISFVGAIFEKDKIKLYYRKVTTSSGNYNEIWVNEYNDINKTWVGDINLHINTSNNTKIELINNKVWELIYIRDGLLYYCNVNDCPSGERKISDYGTVEDFILPTGNSVLYTISDGLYFAVKKPGGEVGDNKQLADHNTAPYWNLKASRHGHDIVFVWDHGGGDIYGSILIDFEFVPCIAKVNRQPGSVLGLVSYNANETLLVYKNVFSGNVWLKRIEYGDWLNEMRTLQGRCSWFKMLKCQDGTLCAFWSKNSDLWHKKFSYQTIF